MNTAEIKVEVLCCDEFAVWDSGNQSDYRNEWVLSKTHIPNRASCRNRNAFISDFGAVSISVQPKVINPIRKNRDLALVGQYRRTYRGFVSSGT